MAGCEKAITGSLDHILQEKVKALEGGVKLFFPSATTT
jgi:hypothetical protein